MKKFFYLLFILSLNSFGQITFEKGYIIKNNGSKEECLIKNYEWDNTPTQIYCKKNPTDPEKAINTNELLEFGIYPNVKYIRTNVEIDKSSNDLNFLTEYRRPNMKKEDLLLHVLLEGKASLYEYKENGTTKYFYKIDNKPIKQLIFKYYSPDGITIRKNETYKQQIFSDLKCPEITLKQVERLPYKRTSLLKIFIKYNECVESNYKNFIKNKGNGEFHINPRAGINFSSLKISNPLTPNKNAEFNSKISPRISLELEYILPFNKNKWGVLLEPTYRTYSEKKIIYEGNLYGGSLEGEVNYSSIEIPLGLRYYMFLNNKSKIFVNISYIYDFIFNSNIKFIREDGQEEEPLDLQSFPNYGLGAGYNYEKFYFELRYQTNRSILSGYSFWSSEFKNMSLIFGYRFL